MKELIFDVTTSLKESIDKSLNVIFVVVDVDNFDGVNTAYFDCIAVCDNQKRYHALYLDDKRVTDWRECKGGK